jgi:hypothetical protein
MSQHDEGPFDTVGWGPFPLPGERKRLSRAEAARQVEVNGLVSPKVDEVEETVPPERASREEEPWIILPDGKLMKLQHFVEQEGTDAQRAAVAADESAGVAKTTSAARLKELRAKHSQRPSVIASAPKISAEGEAISTVDEAIAQFHRMNGDFMEDARYRRLYDEFIANAESTLNILRTMKDEVDEGARSAEEESTPRT